MIRLTYKVDFFSEWHCGSGLNSGNDADLLPLRNDRNLPFIPGKTIKGLLREAGEILFDPSFVTRVFGEADRKNICQCAGGQCSFSNATLADDIQQAIDRECSQLLYNGRYFIRLDNDGQVEDKSLRRINYAVPLTLQGQIDNIGNEDLEKVKDCLQYIKRLGFQRSRGFGRCEFIPLEAKKYSENDFSKNVVFELLPDGTKRYFLKCIFKSDIVLNRSAATSGNLDCLDYIPGANFLGIAASQLYGSLDGNEFEVFHSGHVRFGDGMPLIDNQPSLVKPLSWFYLKDGDPDCLANTQDASKDQSGSQLKQIRGGYFTVSAQGKYRSVKTPRRLFSLKSAYDSSTRSNQDGQLFGYTALPADSEWYFTVEFSPSIKEENVNRVIKSLCGMRKLGRSRSAQYGDVEISSLPILKYNAGSTASAGNCYYLYALSNIALFGEDGSPTFTPSPNMLGFADDAQMIWDKCHLQTMTYAPWNHKRHARDAERFVIMRGSVLAVKSATPPLAEIISNGIGAYLAEGFGKVMVSPEFLTAKKLDAISDSGSERQQKNSTESIVLYLKKKMDDRKRRTVIYQKVMEFIHANREDARKAGISPSQWGAIRERCLASTNYEDLENFLFKEDAKEISSSYEDTIKNNRASRLMHPGYLKHGRQARCWEKSQMGQKLKEALQSFHRVPANAGIATLEFAELLCAEMGKNGGEKC